MCKNLKTYTTKNNTNHKKGTGCFDLKDGQRWDICKQACNDLFYKSYRCMANTGPYKIAKS